MHPKKKHIIDVYGKEPETLDELAQCVIAVIEAEKNTDNWPRKNSRTKNFKVDGFAWDIHWIDRVPNTHSSPINGIQNWEKEPNKPFGYPGWTGRVWIRYKEEPVGFGSDAFARTLTYTGTGGAGGYQGPWEEIGAARFKRFERSLTKAHYSRIPSYSWDYRIYQSDWPIIDEKIRQDLMFHKLADTQMPAIRHKFLWQDPAMVISDTEFMAESAIIEAKKEKLRAY